MRDTQRLPDKGQNRRVTGLGGHFQGLPGVAAAQVAVTQTSVALPEAGQGPALSGLACQVTGPLEVVQARARWAGKAAEQRVRYQVCSAARTSVSLTATRRSLVTM